MYAASSGRYTASSAGQPSNASSIIVTVLLQLTCTVVSDLQESNAELDIDATLNGITIDLRPEIAKVDDSISESTEPGANVTANFDEVHDWNALFPNDVNVDGRIIEPREVHD